jgi:hypothetical protein
MRRLKQIPAGPRSFSAGRRHGNISENAIRLSACHTGWDIDVLLARCLCGRSDQEAPTFIACLHNHQFEYLSRPSTSICSQGNTTRTVMLNRHRCRRLGLLLATFALTALIAPVGSDARAGQGSDGKLGQGRRGSSLQWAAWGEPPPSGATEEACVTVLTVERGSGGDGEGSETTNCGYPKQAAVDEISRSRFGIVVAALFRPVAGRAVITFGRPSRKPVRLKVGHTEIGEGAAATEVA